MRELWDGHGVYWTVWEVVPESSERRRHAGTAPGGLERRRFNLGPRAQVSPEFAEGWLAFQSHAERRRLVPVPAGWEEMSDAELADLCASAMSSGPPRRLP